MQNKKTRNLLTVILSLLCAVLLGCSVAVFNGLNNKTANAKAPEGGDITIGELAINTDGSADANGKVFDGEKLTALYDAILGTNYAGTATLKNVEKYINTKGTAKRGSGVDTKAISSADLRTANGGSNVYVTLGGIQWEVVYVTTNKTGQVIVDLWQATNTSTSTFSLGGTTDYISNTTYTNLSNLYGTSYIRAVTLGMGGTYYQYSGTNMKGNGTAKTASTTEVAASAYKNFVSGNFASYIDAPVNVDYQEKQSWVELANQPGPNNGAAYNLPNDAYGIPTVENYFKGGVGNTLIDRPNTITNYSGRDSVTLNSSGQTVTIPNNRKEGYDNWKNDKVWLPSLTETGNGTATNVGEGIWQLDTNQRVNTDALNSWLRSASYTDSSYVYSASANVNMNANAAITAYVVRPALHLNLNSVAESSKVTAIKVPVPQSVSAEYDGNAKWLDALETVTNTDGSLKYPWIDSTLHTNTSIVNVKKIEYTPADVLGADTGTKTDVTSGGTSNIKAAGKYSVTLEINSSATGYEWRGGGTGEKTFTLTVAQKEIPYTLQIKKNGSAVTKLAYGDTYTYDFTQSTVAAGDLPTDAYEILYSGTGTTTYAASATAPTNAGNYKLEIKAKNDGGSPAKNIATNYKLVGSAAQFEIQPKGFNPITIAAAASKKQYNGDDQSFQLSGSFDGTNMEIKRTGFTLDTTTTPQTYNDGVAWDPANNRITVKDADTYTFSFDLKDKVNYCWLPYPTDGSAYDSAAKEVTLEVEACDLVSKISVDPNLTTGNTGNVWGLGDAGALVLKVEPLGSDAVTLYLEYFNKSDISFSTPYVAGIDNANLKLDVQQLISVGDYVLRARLQTDSDSNYSVANKNYKIGTDGYWTFDFTIGAGSANVKLNWGYKQDNDIASNPLFDNVGNQNPLVYNGKVYTISATIDSTTSYANPDSTTRTGYVNGYMTYLASDSSMTPITDGIKAAGTYRTRIALVVDSAHEFDANHRFSANDGTHGWVEITWKISQKEIDLNNAKWEYSYDLSSDTWYDFADGNPEFSDLGVYVRLSYNWLKSEGIKSDDADSVELNYSGGVVDNPSYSLFMSPKGTNYIAYAEVLLKDSNYTLAGGTNPQTVSKTFDITAKQITLTWSATALELETSESISYTYGVSIAVDKDNNDCSDKFDYQFRFNDTNGVEQVMTFEQAKAYFKANASREQVFNGTVELILKNPDDYAFKCDSTHTFSVGASLPAITITVTGSGTPYTNVEFGLTAVNGTNSYVQHLTVKVYTYRDYHNSPVGEPKFTADGSNVSSIQEFLNTCDAGNYIIEIEGKAAVSSFVLKNDVWDFEIAKQKVVVPIVENADKIIYKAGEYSILDYLKGFDDTLMEVDALHSDTTGKTAKTYTLTINLLDPKNYTFVQPAAAGISPSKAIAKLALTDGQTAETRYNISADGSYVDIDWQILKFVITDSMFNQSTGELRLPAQFDQIRANDMLQLGYQYYADKTSSEPLDPESLKAGETYYVVATLGGECAENFVFENASMTSAQTSQRVTFKTTQGGFNAFIGKIGSFMTATWLGLPIWAWFLIGLALLILLIIIIVVACKRRKSKEEKAEAKARKEEEKARREEERRMQQERLEAERELARAKQEAELEKIRMQAQMAGAAGMATMAMQQPQQQPAQQQMPQPVQQQMPQQMPQPQVQYVQSNDNSVLAEIKAELAEIKARQNMGAGYAQPAMPAAAQPAAQSLSAYANDPVATAELIRLKAESEAHMRAELERARSEAERARMEAELAKVRAESRYAYPAQQFDGNGMGGDMQKIGALAVAIWQSMQNGGQQPAMKAPEVPQLTEESVSASAMYPPDAVVTTTTTVDTTQKPLRRDGKSDRNDFVDVDGFYDSID